MHSFDLKFLPNSFEAGSGPVIALMKFRPSLFGGGSQEFNSLPLTERSVQLMTPAEGSTEIFSERTPFWQCSDTLGILSGFVDLGALNGSLGLVNKKSCEAAIEEKKVRLRDYVDKNGFGAKKWEHFFGKVQRVPLPLELLDILNRPCPIDPKKTVQETHLLFLLPNTVNGQPLTLNSLEALAQAPKEGSGGHATKYGLLDRRLMGQFGGKTESCWVLMLKDIMPQSRNKSFYKQCSLIPSRSLNWTYEVPDLLEATAGIVIRFVGTGERLFSSKNPWTYTLCKQKHMRTYRWIVGGFNGSGPYIFFTDSVNGDNGLAILRKLPRP